jgi:transcriptional regulator with XRE-family HTH domain
MAARIRPRAQIHYYIREHRIDHDLTQEQLAARLGDGTVNKGTVSRWEGGQRTPDLGTLLAICEALGITLAQLQQLPPPKTKPAPAKPPKPTKAEKKMAEQLVADFLAKRRAS